MKIEDYLRDIRKKGFYIEIHLKNRGGPIGKISKIDRETIRICPYFYSGVPFSDFSKKFFYKKVTDREIIIKISEIIGITPIPDEYIKLVEKQGEKILKEGERKAGF